MRRFVFRPCYSTNAALLDDFVNKRMGEDRQYNFCGLPGPELGQNIRGKSYPPKQSVLLRPEIGNSSAKSTAIVRKTTIKTGTKKIKKSLSQVDDSDDFQVKHPSVRSGLCLAGLLLLKNLGKQ